MLPTASNRVPLWIVAGLVITALVGFTDSAYLTAEHVRGVVPPCTVVTGCEQVLTSTYAVVAGIPVSAVGMLFYGTVLVLIIAFLDTDDRRFLHIACWLGIAGFFGTLFYLYVQAFVLHAFCLYCLLSALTSTLLFVIGASVLRLTRDRAA